MALKVFSRESPQPNCRYWSYVKPPGLRMTPEWGQRPNFWKPRASWFSKKQRFLLSFRAFIFDLKKFFPEDVYDGHEGLQTTLLVSEKHLNTFIDAQKHIERDLVKLEILCILGILRFFSAFLVDFSAIWLLVVFRKILKIPTRRIYHQIYERICELWIWSLRMSWGNCWSQWRRKTGGKGAVYTHQLLKFLNFQNHAGRISL